MSKSKKKKAGRGPAAAPSAGKGIPPAPPGLGEAEEGALALESPAEVADEAAAPEPEPWTEETAGRWNRYYDRYVSALVLALVFVASFNTIGDSGIWSLLDAGRRISAGASPGADTATWSHGERSWVNIPWLFEVANWQAYRAAERLVPESTGIADPARNERHAAGALVLLTALIQVGTAAALLTIRRAGPGLWWGAVCVGLTLGAIAFPVITPTQQGAAFQKSVLLLGGLAGSPRVEPATWGLFFLAIELALLHRALVLGKPRAAIGLPILFALWANVHDSFAFGLIILGAAALGQAVEKGPARGEGRKLGCSKSFLLLAACALAVLANPFIWKVYPAAFQGFREHAAFVFNTARIRDLLADEYSIGFQVLWVASVLLGLGSFALNLGDFSPSRFAMFLAATILWTFNPALTAPFALVWCATMTLNGQEWWHQAFGTRGQTDFAWSIWSVGGRAVTIILIFLAIVLGITGWAGGPNLPGFAFNLRFVDTERLPFEAAEFLRTAQIEGNVLNANAAQGDAILWKGEGKRTVYLDSRPHASTAEDRAALAELRKNQREDDESFREFLDAKGVSAVMVPMGFSSMPPRFYRRDNLEAIAANTYKKLLESRDWVLFWDDGNVAIFGRAGAPWVPLWGEEFNAAAKPGSVPAKDTEFFAKNRLDSASAVFARSQAVPSSDRPPAPVNFIDRITPGRFNAASQARILSSQRWMARHSFNPIGSGLSRELASPADCIMAVREARIAIARDPDDPFAYSGLAEAYSNLLILETALLAGLEPTDANAPRIRQILPQPSMLEMRFQQLLTALTYAIQTTPPPRDPDEKRELGLRHYRLADLHRQVGHLDLARDHLRTYTQLVPADEVDQQVMNQLDQLEAIAAENLKAVEDAQADPNNSLGQVAMLAQQRGLPMTALDRLNDALKLGETVVPVKPLLVDLCCRIGMPDRVGDNLGTQNEPTLSDGPGTAAHRQGMVSLLMGNYLYASDLWGGYALRELRGARVMQALGSLGGLARGAVVPAILSYRSQQIPRQSATQSLWEFELGLCLLEMGEPDRAAEHLVRSLQLSPDSPLRPVIAYYLRELGRPVPPPPDNRHEAGGTSEPSATPAPATPPVQ